MSWSDLARRVVRQVQGGLPKATGGGWCLAYHLVGAGTGSPVDLPEDVFRRQMEELAESARVVSLAELPSALLAPGDDRPAVVLTFDDAFDNFRTHAWPVLLDLGLPATLFVPVGFVEGEAPAPLAGAEHLAAAPWSSLVELVEASDPELTIGSHGWNHLDTRRLGPARRRRELVDSRRRLEQELDTRVDSFCYPRGLWDRRSENWVAQSYQRAVVGGGRRLSAKNFRPLSIPRVSLRADGPASLAPILAARAWWEERLADRIRRRRPVRRPPDREAQ